MAIGSRRVSSRRLRWSSTFHADLRDLAISTRMRPSSLYSSFDDSHRIPRSLNFGMRIVVTTTTVDPQISQVPRRYRWRLDARDLGNYSQRRRGEQRVDEARRSRTGWERRFRSHEGRSCSVTSHCGTTGWVSAAPSRRRPCRLFGQAAA